MRGSLSHMHVPPLELPARRSGPHHDSALCVTPPTPPPYRLKDIIYSDKQLYLVFEWVDKDLKKYMDSVAPVGMPMPLVKVRALSECAVRVG